MQNQVKNEEILLKNIKKNCMKTYKSLTNTFRIVKEQSNIPKAQIKSSQDAFNYSSRFYFEDIDVYESFFIILLNRACNTEAYVKIGQGGIVGCAIDIRIILKYAIDSLASSVILIHNHPSGNILPSESDINITKKIQNALEIVDVKLLDHLVITKNEYYSFADEGLIR
jgi:DNA repair protein RadC